MLHAQNRRSDHLPFNIREQPSPASYIREGDFGPLSLVSHIYCAALLITASLSRVTKLCNINRILKHPPFIINEPAPQGVQSALCNQPETNGPRGNRDMCVMVSYAHSAQPEARVFSKRLSSGWAAFLY